MIRPGVALTQAPMAYIARLKRVSMIDVEVPVIPLYYLTNQYLFRDDVKGINLNPRNMTMLKGVYVERKGS
jgi:ABC-type oligopeptide transport system substrate-binding subunit